MPRITVLSPSDAPQFDASNAEVPHNFLISESVLGLLRDLRDAAPCRECFGCGLCDVLNVLVIELLGDRIAVSGSFLEFLHVWRAKAEQVDYIAATVAESLGEPDALADCGVILLGVSGGRVNHYERAAGQGVVPVAGQHVAMTIIHRYDSVPLN